MTYKCVTSDGDHAAHAVDWRLYSQSHSLTDKQQKLADKIRRQELKIHNLQTETDRIKVCSYNCIAFMLGVTL